MKYIATILILIAMGWTWSLSTTASDFSLEQHRELEQKQEALITEIIKKNNPAATNIVFSQMFTEVVRPQKEIKVHFRYKYSEPGEGGAMSEQTEEGTILLKSNDGSAWQMAAANLEPSVVRFQDEIQVRRGAPTDPPPESEPAQNK